MVPHPALTIIVNPAAGRGRGLRALPAIERLLAGRGVDFVARISESPKDPERIAREAAADGAKVVAAIGGDGLAGMVANALVGTGAALAVIPTGTGNDFARMLGIDRRHPTAASRMLIDPRIEPIDVVRISTSAGERIYVNVAGAGFDSAVNETANRMKPRLHGTATYIVALVKTLRRFTPANFTITLDGEDSRTLPAMMIAFGNGRSYGGGMRVCPNASLADGFLEICIVQAMGKGEFLRSFPKVFRGTHVRHPKVEMLRAAQVRIAADRDVQIYADGEPAGLLPATLTVLPHALRVVMP